MNGFEVYKIYLAIKLHFTSKNQSYDYHKHHGRTTARMDTFTKRRDRYFFHKLSRTYSDIDVTNYFVSNFVSNTNLWIGDIIGRSGDDNYKTWSKKVEALHYYYEQDIDYILSMITNKLWLRNYIGRSRLNKIQPRNPLNLIMSILTLLFLSKGVPTVIIKF